jgi:hypothetical protein
MANIKRILKDPMCVGALVGLGLGVCWVLFILLYDIDYITPPPPAFEVALRAVFFGTYPARSLEVLLDTNVIPASLETVVFFGSICIWYTQYGFFSGLFFRILRRQYSKRISGFLLASAICLIASVLLYVNRSIWW